MKKAFTILTISVPDDFTAGDCYNCPLLGHFVEVNPFDLTDMRVLQCRLYPSFNKTNCPLEIEEEE